MTSDEAQTLHDHIASGFLTIHLHAHDGHTTVAVGTYRGQESVNLHGENHLRVVSMTYDRPSEAITEFERLYGDAVRPGPAPLTKDEQQAARAHAEASTASPPDAVTESAAVEGGLVPVYAADPADHEAVLDRFLNEHADWAKYRTWSDEVTDAVHESLVLCVELQHSPEARPCAAALDGIGL
ncbi:MULTISPECIES: hypothetical protein [unclassified Streptomyces]|uniref:hypothetical protein n=1 Tax=unclassified Streptomyces TaxID=2593676 RepID=UPI003627F875